MNPIFSEPTKQFITQYSKRLPQAILLSGGEGTGLYTLAKHLAATNGRLFDVISPIKATKSALAIISVERVRDLYEITRTKATTPYFVIIDDTDRMNVPAQNAFLKLLEEPNQNIHFILTSHSPDQLLPTIRSRVEVVHVAPLSDESSLELIRSLGITDQALQRQLMYIAGGFPAMITRLASDSTILTRLSDYVRLSRRFVEGTPYDRMVVINTFKDDRGEALAFIGVTLHLLKESLKSKASEHIMVLIEKLLMAEESIRANGNIRLQLTACVV
jgi:replication-associated recombination protein RarA